MPLSLDQYVSVHATALDVRARRGELIANNLANADTPGYQARDIDFRQAMARAAGDKTVGATMTTTQPATSAAPRRPMPPAARTSSTARRWRLRSTATPSTRSSSRPPSRRTPCATRRRCRSSAPSSAA